MKTQLKYIIRVGFIMIMLLGNSVGLYAGNVKRVAALTVTITAHTNVSCNGGSNGSATAKISSGNPPYSFSWSSGTTGTGTDPTITTITGLTAGTYTITATDAFAHTATASVTITQPPVLSVSIAVTNVSCNGGSDGLLKATPSGGTSAYTYSWSNGTTSATDKGLTAGTYTLTVTDAHGCTVTASATITQPTVLTANVGQIINVLCNGASTGQASGVGQGGTPSYTYLWSPGGYTNSTVTGLSAGTYTFKVTDANGCIAKTTATITQPSKIKIAMNESDVLCYGGNTGTASAKVSGGTPGYTYSWAPGGQTSAMITGLTAGTYTVTVTDMNRCTATDTITVDPIPQLIASIPSVTNITCNGAFTGSATATATGGTGAYTYSWAPAGGGAATANNISAGTYTVTVRDKNGCIATAATTITQPATPFTVSATSTGTCGNSLNSASATVSGGTSPYTYLWSPGGQTSSNATGLTAGTYTVTVTDANHCTTSSTINVHNLSGPSVTINPTGVTIYSGQHVTLAASVTGGAIPYTYSWTPSTALSCTNCYNPTASPTSNITYTLTVIDANGCTGTASSMVDVGIAPPVNTPVSCDTCIGGLDMQPGKTYLVSVWAKNNTSLPSDTDYKEPSLKIEFGSTVFGPFYPQGRIIDGWQRIEGTFTVPLTASLFNIVLSCTGGACNFDDIRVFPFNGTMKTYVYDPNTLRLIAVLDERNYATIYEYDEEGKLVRVKKETERGIMTIQESRTAMQKR